MSTAHFERIITTTPLGIARAIHTRRIALGISRRDLAEAANLSYPYLSEIENGKKACSTRALGRIAPALGWTPSELYIAAEQVAGTIPVTGPSDEPTLADVLAEIQVLRQTVEQLAASLDARPTLQVRVVTE